MRELINRRRRACGLAILAILYAAIAHADQLAYRATVHPGSEWSFRQLSVTPTGRRYLGPLGPATQTLTLPLPPHENVTLSFNLFVIGDWGGAGGVADGFQVIANARPVLQTSFSNHSGVPQGYPGGFSPTYPPQTGAFEVNSLSTSGADAVYHFVLRFPDTAALASIQFTASTAAAWGLENIELHTDTPGAALSWGYNGVGELGQGFSSFSGPPAYLSGLYNISSIAAGNSHALATTPLGQIYAWGFNNVGELGVGDTANRTLPTPVFGASGHNVAAGGWQSFVYGRSQTPFGFGYNSNGQLGDGTATERDIPAALPLLPASSDWVSIAGGAYHSLALTASGSVYAWGWGGRGQLGDGTTNTRYEPAAVPGLSGVVAIAAGHGEGNFSLALKSDGTVWAWGANDLGQIGVGQGSDRLIPTQVPNLPPCIAIAAGDYHAMALTQDGRVLTWGANDYGQLGSPVGGVGNPPVSGPQDTGLQGVLLIDAGARHSLAVTLIGVLAVGENRVGQLGTMPGPSASTWQTVPGTDGLPWRAVTSAAYHSFVVRPFFPQLLIASIDFSHFQLGGPPVSPPVTISNPGSDPVEITGVHVTIDTNGDGVYDSTGDIPLLAVTSAADSCSGHTIAAGSSCQVLLTLTPSAAGHSTGRLHVTAHTLNPSVWADAEATIDVTIDIPSTVSIRRPFAGAVYALGQAVAADYSCEDVVSCVGPIASGAAFDTSTVGDHVFSVRGTNALGYTTTQSITYTIRAGALRGWQNTSSMPEPESGGRAFQLFDGRVLVIGGAASAGPSARSYVYDPARNAWSAFPSPAALSLFAAVQLRDGRVLLTGGYIVDPTTNLPVPQSASYVFDPATNSWSTAGSLATARYEHDVVLLADGRVLATGGATGHGLLSSAEVFDPALNFWTGTGSMTRPRARQTSTLLLDGRVLIVGGRNGSGNALPDAEYFDPGSMTFSAAPAPPVAEVNHAALRLADGSVLVAGGSPSWLVDAIPYSSTYRFIPSSATWVAAGDLSVARSQPAMVSMADGRIIAAGGFNGRAVAVVDQYDPIANTWSPGEPMSAGRYAAASIALADGGVLVAGGAEAGLPLDSAEIYDGARGIRSLTLPRGAGEPREQGLMTATICCEGVAGVPVRFTLDSISTTAETDSTGTATFQIDLAGFHVGQYSMLAATDPTDTLTGASATSPFVVFDSSAPVVTPVITGTVGQNNWYVSDVTIAWIVRDFESDLTSSTGCEATTITGDTVGTAFTCTATSAGGTTTQSVTIKRDATPPVISIVSPSGGPFPLGAIATASYACTDAISGPATCLGTVPNGSPADMTLGTKLFTVSATDAAGNTATSSRQYTVHKAAAGGYTILAAPSGQLFVIDSTTGVLVDTIQTPGSPYAIAVTPDGGYAVVTDWHGARAFLYDTINDLLVGTFPVGDDPLGVAMSSDGLRAYVTASTSGTVTVLDRNGSCCNITATFAAGHNPIGIAVSPDDQRLYVAAHDDNAVLTLDAHTGAVLASVPSDAPNELALSRDGTKTYVTSFNYAGRYTVIDNVTNTVSYTSPRLGYVHDLSLSDDGTRLYVSVDVPGGSTLVVDTETNHVVSTITTGAYQRHFGIVDDTHAIGALAGEAAALLVNTATGATVTKTMLGQNPVGVAVIRNRHSTQLRNISSTATYGASAAVQVRLLDLNGSPIVHRPITLSIDGGGAAVVMTDDSGVASLDLPTSGLAVGTHFGAVHATFFGDPGLYPSQTTGDLTMARATPTLTWSSPADIVDGTPLGSAQLNATSNVAGTFAYSPAAATVLPAGNGQALTVTFTPADGANYNTASASVTINVLPAPPVALESRWMTPANTPLSGTATATDRSSRSLTYITVTRPQHGTVDLVASTGAFTYTPANNFIGNDAFGFAAVATGGATSNAATVSIAVRDVTAPVVTPPANITVVATDTSGTNARATPALAAFLAGGSAVDDVDTAVTASPPAVGSTSITSDTMFPIGTTAVAFPFTDGSGNVGRASAQVTVIAGKPSLSVAVASKGRVSGNLLAEFVDLRVTNTGTGVARAIALDRFTFRTLNGSGVVGYDTALSPPLPIAVAPLAPGASTIVRVHLDVPSTVTRFVVSGTAAFQDVAGGSFTTSPSLTIFP